MQQYPRIRHFDDGIAMIVTDLHGEGRAYDHIRRTFLNLHEKGEIDRLIICGDLIHIRRNAPDHSLRMILDVMELQSKLGQDTVVMLLGNHEMPHIYNVTLAKGNQEFTAPFEQALTESGKRDEVYRFLRGLPLYVTTNAGVLITHAGATAAVTNDYEAQSILTFDHDALLQLAESRLQNGYNLDSLKQDESYRSQAMHYLAVSGVQDPRYHHLLRGQILSQTEEEFAFLWNVLFTRNEQNWSLDAYDFIATRFLQAIGEVIEKPLNVLVAGHLGTQGGHKLVGRKHLRLSSYAHAHPNESGEYLLLDCEKPVISAADLLPHLRPVFT